MSGARAKQASERSRHPTEIRRQLIVEAARSVIAERGLFATSIRDIAAAGDVSIGTVTYHFTGIADILAEVLIGEMDSFYAPVIAAATAAPDGRAALEEIVDGFIASTPRAREHWALWLDFWALSAHDPGAREPPVRDLPALARRRAGRLRSRRSGRQPEPGLGRGRDRGVHGDLRRQRRAGLPPGRGPAPGGGPQAPAPVDRQAAEGRGERGLSRDGRRPRPWPAGPPGLCRAVSALPAVTQSAQPGHRTRHLTVLYLPAGTVRLETFQALLRLGVLSGDMRRKGHPITLSARNA